MTKLKIYEDSLNYTCQVIKLPPIQKVAGLDKLVKVTYQGNDCLIGSDSDPDELHLFFPAECKIDDKFLSTNNLYRHSELNKDKSQKGFFEDNGRVRSLKFKGIISTGFIIPISSLRGCIRLSEWEFNPGDEFNSIGDINICSKYYKKIRVPGIKPTRKVELVDGRMAPEHFSTSHLLKNCDKLNLDDYIAVTYKLHGTSARYFNTLVKRKLSLLERLSKLFGVKVQKEEYKMVCGSRKVIKSVDLKTLDNKNHWYESGDLWTKVGEEYFKEKLNHGETVYCEIIGKTLEGEAIQGGYTYGLNKPEVFVYRISNINTQGIEVDLHYSQLHDRCRQLGLNTCPELFYGKLGEFIERQYKNFNYFGDLSDPLENLLSNIFYNRLLEKPSILDNSVIEEGYCIRVDKYPKPDIYKIKSKKFLEHETKMIDKEIKDIESDEIN